jgi:predicted GTPase
MSALGQKQTFRAALKERHYSVAFIGSPSLGSSPLGNALLPFIGMIVQLFGRCLFDLS